MSIRAKTKYNLARLLVDIIDKPEDARVYLDDTIDDTDKNNITKLNYDNVIINGISGQEMWSNIIAAADDQKLLLQLVEAVLKKNPGDKLTSFQEDIKNGFDKRVLEIASAIKKNECVLFLGPELLQCKSGTNLQSFNRQFATELCSKLYNAGVYYEEKNKDSLSYVANRYEDFPNATGRDLGKKALEYFSKMTIYKEAYHKITQLKFPLIINTNPDDILEERFKANNVICSSGFYDRSNT